MSVMTFPFTASTLDRAHHYSSHPSTWRDPDGNECGLASPAARARHAQQRRVAAAEAEVARLQKAEDGACLAHVAVAGFSDELSISAFTIVEFIAGLRIQAERELEWIKANPPAPGSGQDNGPTEEEAAEQERLARLEADTDWNRIQDIFDADPGRTGVHTANLYVHQDGVCTAHYVSPKRSREHVQDAVANILADHGVGAVGQFNIAIDVAEDLIAFGPNSRQYARVIL